MKNIILHGESRAESALCTASSPEREKGVLMEDFNSETLDSSCSFPSEPPDIRNWFSSYKYESFALDTCENLGGIVSEETEINRDEFEIGEIN
ncbi:hypothetical protein CCACVL1_24717 [Corchorus capsularis]|uniref:Uncharacterized protein n=1 Tax=Corchorus capsularis TaxID=210143 RepID=A0A1R3GNH0_COCAP|nr:hypothetical protein CCACVL1_24717 [Corchorus capsularis]